MNSKWLRRFFLFPSQRILMANAQRKRERTLQSHHQGIDSNPPKLRGGNKIYSCFYLAKNTSHADSWCGRCKNVMTWKIDWELVKEFLCLFNSVLAGLYAPTIEWLKQTFPSNVLGWVDRSIYILFLCLLQPAESDRTVSCWKGLIGRQQQEDSPAHVCVTVIPRPAMVRCDNTLWNS